MKLIISSDQDPAGSNMYSLFSSEFDFEKDGTYDGFDKFVKDDFVLIKVKSSIIEIEKVCNDFNPSIYICASKHQSAQKKPALTVHCTGNFGKAEMGGEEGIISISPACYVKKALSSLVHVEGFEITMEATHHGPSTMNAPLLFVEVGSSLEEWNNLEACRSVCTAILALSSVESCESVIGFGGPHYAPNFTKFNLNSKYAVGHICPKHFIDELDKEIVKNAFSNVDPKPSYAVIDWKGTTGPQKEKLISILDNLKLPWKKIKQLSPQ